MPQKNKSKWKRLQMQSVATTVPGHSLDLKTIQKSMEGYTGRLVPRYHLTSKPKNSRELYQQLLLTNLKPTRRPLSLISDLLTQASMWKQISKNTWIKTSMLLAYLVKTASKTSYIEPRVFSINTRRVLNQTTNYISKNKTEENSRTLI